MKKGSLRPGSKSASGEDWLCRGNSEGSRNEEEGYGVMCL